MRGLMIAGIALIMVFILTACQQSPELKAEEAQKQPVSRFTQPVKYVEGLEIMQEDGNDSFTFRKLPREFENPYKNFIKGVFTFSPEGTKDMITKCFGVAGLSTEESSACYGSEANVEYGSGNDTFLFIKYSNFELFSSYKKIYIQQGTQFRRDSYSAWMSQEFIRLLFHEDVVNSGDEFTIYKLSNISISQPLKISYFLRKNGNHFNNNGTIEFTIFKEQDITALKNSRNKFTIKVDVGAQR